MSVAKRVSEEAGCELGKEVGYAIRFKDAPSPSSPVQKAWRASGWRSGPRVGLWAASERLRGGVVGGGSLERQRGPYPGRLPGRPIGTWTASRLPTWQKEMERKCGEGRKHW